MRARITLLQALLGLLTTLFGWPTRASETPEDLPWAHLSRKLEKINDLDFIHRTLDRELPGFTAQLKEDARKPELLSLWGLSRNIDESHLTDRQKTVPPSLLRFFNSILKVPYDSGFEVGHAGLTHTYGYLFSTLSTPYGLKRARYVRGEMERGLGLPVGLLNGRHPEGSLLLNLTLLAGPIAFRDDAESLEKLQTLRRNLNQHLGATHSQPREIDALLNFQFTKLHPRTLIESSGSPEKVLLEFRTDWVPYPAGSGALLIHSIKTTKKRKSVNQLITVFPVKDGFADSLFDPKTLGDSVEIKLRYNAMLSFEPQAPLTGRRYILP